MNATNQPIGTAVSRELASIRNNTATQAEYKAMLKKHKPLIELKAKKQTKKDNSSMLVVYVFAAFTIVAVVLNAFNLITE